MEDLTVESCARWADFDPANPSRLVFDMDEAVGREMVGNMTSGDIVDSYNEYAEKNSYEKYYSSDALEDFAPEAYNAIKTLKDKVSCGTLNPDPFESELFKFNGYGKVVFLDYSDAEEEVSDDSGFLRWLATDGGNTVSGDAEEIYDFYTKNKDAIMAKAKEDK